MIDKYLVSTCLFIIDEFNHKFKDKDNTIDKIKLKNIADTEYNESDIAIRLGYPFKDMAHFNFQGRSCDIVVNSKDFVIEVKYLRNFRTKTKRDCFSNKLIWQDAFQKNYNWLCNEIKNGKKGHRAFVLGWFNAVDRFSEIMQLGEGSGNAPDINFERYNLFPFLNRKDNSTKTKDIFYMYSQAYEPLSIQIVGYDKDVLNCMFLGSSGDVFHFAMYW